MKLFFFKNTLSPCRITCMILLLLPIMVTGLQAENNEGQQNGIILKGIVKDTSEEPLIGVSLAIKGTNQGTISNIDGEFTLQLPNTNSTLIVSYVGYKTQEIKVGNRSTIDIVMESNEQLLDEVAVVGYGVQKKLNLTGAVSSIDAGKLENRATANLSTSLAALSPGVNVSQGSGNPGSENVSFLIRGTGSFNSTGPMILIDGAVGTMDTVNPDDVASVSFLKDGASAAIYGSRAANGVILITTKKGNKDSKATVTYSNLFASQKPSTNLHFMSDMPTWMEWHNQAQINTNPATTTLWYEQSLIDTWRAANANPNSTDNGFGIPNWLAYPNTDWAQTMFKANFFQRHNVSVTGGGKTTNYLMSLGYQDNPGTLENTRQERFNMRVNLETIIADRITFGTQTFATKTKKEPGNVSMTYLLQAYPGMNPLYDGKYGASEDPNMSSMNNVLNSVASTGGLNETTTINTTWFAKTNIWDGLTGEVKFNYQDIFAETSTYSKFLPRYRFRDGAETPVEGINTLDNATTSRGFTKTYRYLLDFLLYYNKTFGAHEIGGLLGYEQTYYQSSGFKATKQGLLDWSVTDILSASEMYSIGSTTSEALGSAKTDYAMLSYFGRINYAFASRYLFEANFRADASSRFAPGHRWGYFPSFSAGWRISEEGFYTPLREKVNDLKLRASWGKLGNTMNSNYAWQSLYGKVNGVLNENVSTGLAQIQPANYLLSWEDVTTIDLGIDAYLFNSKLNISADVYQRLSTNILDQPDMSLSLGSLNKQWINTADMKNQGLELSVTWRDQIKDFNYQVSVNATYNKNKITKYRGTLEYGPIAGEVDAWGNPVYGYTNLDKVSTASGNTRKVEGHMINEFYLNTPYSGSGRYYDANGNVDINGGPRDGMIRTKADLEWVNAMVAAGYTFNNVKVDNPTTTDGNTIGGRGGNLWYGEMIMADINGDGNYGSSDDRVFTGKSSVPKWILGSTISADWKGVDMSMTWEARLGSYAYLSSRGINGNITEKYDAIAANAPSDYYTYDAKRSIYEYDTYDPATDPNANVNGIYPRLLTMSSTSSANTYFLYNTSFLKLRSLQIGYTLPQKWMSAAKISKLRVFFAGENLLTIKNSKYPGIDPELGSSVIVYPISKMFSGGLNITF